MSQIPKQKRDYRLEKLDDEMLLFHPTEKVIMYCNPTASLVWQLCDGQRTTAEIVDLLRNAYPENSDTIATDVDATLQEYAEHGAIEFV